MNRIFGLTWNRARAVLQVVSELTRSAGGESARSAGIRRRRRALASAVMLGLVLTAAPAIGATLDTWNADGAMGGSGIWSLTEPNWTDSTGTSPNAPWPASSPGAAVFGGEGGTVTIDDGPGNVNATGMQFTADGYVLTGDALTLVSGSPAAPVISVDGGATTTINSLLAGSKGLTKSGAGTLVLGGANTYAGDTMVDGGTLEIASGGSLSSGTVTVDGGTDPDATLKVDSGVSLSGSHVLRNGATLDNAGAVAGAGNGPAVESDASAGTVNVDNHDGSTLAGGFTGVNFRDGGTVDNDGDGSRISAQNYAVSIDGAAGMVTNTGGAAIEGGRIGVWLKAGGTVTNAGAGSSITSTTNSTYGTVYIGGAPGTVSNQSGASIVGVTHAVTLATGDGSFLNAGTITGNVTMASSATNAATLVAGGSIDGDLDVGTNNASTLTLDGAAGTTQLYSDAVTGTTSFAGDLIKTGQGIWIIDGSGLSSVAGTTVDGGTLEIASGGSLSSGTVTVDGGTDPDAMLKVDSGVSLFGSHVLRNGATLDNAGAVVGAGNGPAVESDASAGTVNVDNHDGGTLTGGFTGVNFRDGGTVDNDGDGSRISAQNYAVSIDGAAGMVTNTGGAAIEGGRIGVWLKAGGTVTNAGAGSSITSTTDSAYGTVYIGGAPGTVSNQSGASIVGVTHAVTLATGDGSFLNAGTITGNVTMASSATNAATLVAGGSIDGDLDVGTNNASTLTLDGAAGTTQWYSDAVTGTTTFAGDLTKTGQGTWVIDNDGLSASRYTNVNGGTLEVAAGGKLGTYAITVDDSAGQNATLKIDAGVSLSGRNIVLGNGATFDNAGTVAGIGNGPAVKSDAGVAHVNNHDGGTLTGGYTGVNLPHGGTVTNDGSGSKISATYASGQSYAVSISGASGTVTNTGGAAIEGVKIGVWLREGGTVTNAGTGSSITSTTDSAGAVYITGGPGAVINQSGASISGSTTAITMTWRGSILNAGSITGTVKMASGGVNDVTLVAGGSIDGNLSMGTNRASTLTLFGVAGTTQLYSDAVTGATFFSGALAKMGQGTWVIDSNGLLKATGITIDAGTLQIGDGGTVGSIGSYDVTNNGALVFNRSNNVKYPGAISGSGSFAQAGDGVLTLNGVNTFTGGTSVQSGTLIVGDDEHADASLAGAVHVAKGATLGGMGSIGSLDLAGALNPGNSVGTLHVAGDATLEKGSSFVVEANPDGSADRLAVGGKVSIEGANTLVMGKAGNWAPQTHYTIITAGGGVSGSFESVSSSLAFLDPILTYQPNQVDLLLQRNDIHFSDVATTVNERNVATVENRFGFGNDLYDALVVLDAEIAPMAFRQTSGEINASQQTARMQDTRFVRAAMNQRLRDDEAGDKVARVQGTRLTTWVHGWGHWGTVDGDRNAAGFSDRGNGVLVGADLALGESGKVGVTGGVAHNSLTVRDRGSWSHLSAKWLGVYGGLERGAFAVRAGAAYAWEQVPSHREVGFTGFSDHLSSHADGNAVTGYLEGAWGFTTREGTHVESYLNLAGVQVQTDAAIESGGMAALRMGNQKMQTGLVTLGARGTWRLVDRLSLHAGIGWRYALGDITPQRTQQFAMGGDVFTVHGTPLTKNAAEAKLDLDWQLTRMMKLNVGYEGMFGMGAGIRDQAARVRLSMAF